MGFWPWSGSGRTMVKSVVSFNERLLEVLACPLSKQPLRFCSKSGELISDSLGVAYKVVDGVPHMIPTDARILNEEDVESKSF